VVDHVIANDNDTVSAARVIKPKMFKGLLFNYFADLSRRGLISDVAFSEGRTTVAISTTNPDRLEVFFPYKRTGIARIIATEAQAGFNFGVIQ
jgi:phage tail sheath gpL-like